VRASAPAPAPAPAPAGGGGLGDLSGFKNYAAWQAANRAEGGSGNSGQVESFFSGLTGGQAKPGGGTTPYVGPADTSKWRTEVGMAEDVHPDAATKSGDPFVDMIRGGGTGSEDYKRFSHAQILAWKDKYDPEASKAAGIPKFRNDFGDIVDKPTESGPLSKAAGYATGEKSAGKRGAGGGGGGRGGAGGSMSASTSTTTASSTAPGGDLASMMDANLKKALAGDTSRYSPEAMQGLLAQIKQRVESSKATQVRQAQEEAAGRGMSRSGRTGTNLAAIRRGAEADFTGEYSNVLKSKIDADRQDKLDALDRSQKYLDSMRDELYRRDMSAIQRQQFKANLDLAYANIQAQRDAMESQQQYGKDMLAANYGYQGTFGGM
jgi:hypothetical protein